MTSRVDFRVLGALQARAGTVRLPVGTGREQRILATLLLEPGRAVPVERLIDAVWDTDPPATSRNQIRNRISWLRKQWAEHAPGAEDVLSTDGAGYRIDVRADGLDLLRMEDFQRRARTATQSGQPLVAIEELRHAYALWTGPTLDGVAGAVLLAAAARLDDLRLNLLEERAALELAAGRHRELLDELSLAADRHPFREQLVAHLMLARYRSGRQADALAAYTRCAGRLRTELGIDPGAALRRLHERILRGEADLDAPAAPERVAATRPAVRAVPRPAELPGDVADFVGRSAELAVLDGYLGGAATGVAIAVISGTAGAGKTALAVHWAHRVAGRFPDGQIYLNLRGFSTTPAMRPLDALACVLRALGVEADQVPATVDEASRMFRTLVAGKRMMLVLDNALSADQVRPLLPGASGNLVIVTTRARLSGLVAGHGARRLTLGVLGADEAVDLLVRTIGEAPVIAEPRAAADLVHACACLPLALRIAAADIAARPNRPLAGYVADLTDGDRITRLRIDGDSSAIHTVFDVSYRTLGDDARRMFRIIGLLPGTDVSASAAAVAAGVPAPVATDLLDRLAAAHVLDEVSPSRYGCHDLLRLYARQRADAEDSPAQRRAALDAALDWYAATAAAAARRLHPHMRLLPDTNEPPRFASLAGATAWLDAEYANLVAAAREAGTARHPAAWLLADALRGYCWIRGHTGDWLAIARTGIEAARIRGDVRGQAAAEISLAFARYSQARYRRSLRHYKSALRLSRRAGWDGGTATALGNIGLAYMHVGDLRRAERHLLPAVTVDRRLGRPLGMATSLRTLGHVHLELGRIESGHAHLVEALELYRKSGSDSGRAIAHESLAYAMRLSGRLAEASEQVSRALAIYREIGDPDGEAGSLNEQASIHLDGGHLDDALASAVRGLHIAGTAGRYRARGALLNTLGRIRLARGEPGFALGHHRRALAIGERGEARRLEIDAHLGCAAALHRTGDLGAAGVHAQRALDLATAREYRILAGTALTTLALVHSDRGERDLAARLAGQALDLHTTTGYLRGVAQARLALDATGH